MTYLSNALRRSSIISALVFFLGGSGGGFTVFAMLPMTPVIAPNASPFAILCIKLVVLTIGLHATRSDKNKTSIITLMVPSFRANRPTAHAQVHG